VTVSLGLKTEFRLNDLDARLDWGHLQAITPSDVG
jgi:hypothetical protein